METRNYEKPQEEGLNDEKFPEIIPNTEGARDVAEPTMSDTKKQETDEQKKQRKLLENAYRKPATKKEGLNDETGEEKKEDGGEISEEKNKEEVLATDGTKIGRKVFGFIGDTGMGILRFGARKTRDVGIGVLRYGFNALFRPWENERGKTIYSPGPQKEKPKE